MKTLFFHKSFFLAHNKNMKKLSIFICLCIILLFCITVNSCFCSFFYINNNTYSHSEIIDNSKNNQINTKTNKSKQEQLKLYNKLNQMGFSLQQIIKYMFAEKYKEIEDISNKEYISPQNATIEAVKNQAKVRINFSKNGRKVDKNKLYRQIIYNLSVKNEKELKPTYIELLPQIKEKQLKEKVLCRSEFATTYTYSSSSRKHNIKKAMQAIDGIIVKPNEIFSFNQTTGERSEKNGYKKANIIKKGNYEESLGGGVCQVSTTLYNACLHAGLEIVEVNSHSLAVGYVSPCFDAMVNMGSSDFRFKNNTGSDIILTCCDDGDKCLIRVYGEKNNKTIVTRSNIVKEIEPSVVICDDPQKIGKHDEYKNGDIIIYPKRGLIAEGFIDEYDEDGTLIVTRRERKSIYKPINQVVYFREEN